MAEQYSCGHQAEFDEEYEYINGSYALWEECTREWEEATAYGTLCYVCFPVYRARKCKLGGGEIDE